MDINLKARFLPPRDNYLGNLLWNKKQFANKEIEIKFSLLQLSNLGYWVSTFPEGDGVVFKLNSQIKTDEEMFKDFQAAFNWIMIENAQSKNSNSELADLEGEDKRVMKCLIIVPLEKIFIQETIGIGKYTFFCRVDFDEHPSERLANFEGEYLQFETDLIYKDLLKLNNSFQHDNDVINKCLSLAEQAMDIVRYTHSSFLKREFTPNPAGQRDDGFYSVNIIPLEDTHLKGFELTGIFRPLSVQNNWLGPEVNSFGGPGIGYISSIYSNHIDTELAKAVIVALRSCRQSFYSIGYESQFLNLIFTLDGLVNPEEWTGWKHRTYIASLISHGNPTRFAKALKKYDHLYSEVRNKLVHEGKDFYEISTNPEQACEEVYDFIKDVIELISSKQLTSYDTLKDYAIDLLKTQAFIEQYTVIINESSHARGKQPRIPQWQV